MDRADAAQAQIARDGLTYKTEKTGAIHAHPAIAIETTARRQFVRLWLAPGFDWDDDLDTPEI
jgi:hypothetical protein